MSYGGHLDISGDLIPTPGAFHPALAQVRTLLLKSTGFERWVEIDGHPHYFTLSIIMGEDQAGRQWKWNAWTDELGRSVGGIAQIVK